MRHDMWTVIIEPPRHGHQTRNRKTRMRLPVNQVNRLSQEELEDYDSGPFRAGMSRNSKHQDHNGSKEFSDLLGPLDRFLHSRVGRLWNAVHSEISAKTDTRSFMQNHLWTHVLSSVDTHCILGEDGIVYQRPRFRYGLYPADGLYVHPVTGVLCYKEPWRYRPNKAANKVTGRLEREFGIKNPNQLDPWKHQDWHKVFRIVDKNTVLEKKGNCWFIRRFVPYLPDDVVDHYFSSVTGHRVEILYRSRSRMHTMREVSCKQMSKRLLRQYRDAIQP